MAGEILVSPMGSSEVLSLVWGRMVDVKPGRCQMTRERQMIGTFPECLTLLVSVSVIVRLSC